MQERAAGLVASLVALLLGVVWGLYQWLLRRHGKRKDAILRVGFLHPACDAGGGGERVLWLAVAAMLRCDSPELKGCEIVLFNRHVHHNKETILKNVEKKFGQHFSPEEVNRLEVVPLYYAYAMDAEVYKVATLIGQAVGYIIVTAEALFRSRGLSLLIDTQGLSWGYPLAAAILGVEGVATYTHYPMLSKAMLRKVASREEDFNNSGVFTRNSLLARMKLAYYTFLTAGYRYLGNYVGLVMVNSSWTRHHFLDFWPQRSSSLHPTPQGTEPLKDGTGEILPEGAGFGGLTIVYPPCNTTKLLKAATTEERLKRRPLYEDVLSRCGVDVDSVRSGQVRVVVSVGQYRPEKNQRLQILAMDALTRGENAIEAVLLMIGSVRNSGDEQVAQMQRDLIKTHSLESAVKLVTNIPYDELEACLACADAGVHTMRDEHFGIGIVEMMAAGLPVVAHCSGGPLDDIVRSNGEKGFLATTPSEYASCLREAWSLDKVELQELINRAQTFVGENFSDERFQSEFNRHITSLLKSPVH